MLFDLEIRFVLGLIKCGVVKFFGIVWIMLVC